MNRQEVKQEIALLITDELQRQNTAPRVRDALGYIVDTSYNKDEDTIEARNPAAFPVTETVGDWQPGEQVELNADVWPVIKKILNATKTPTFSAPGFALEDGLSLVKAGAVLPVNLSFNFDRGAVWGANVGGVWDRYALQAYRAGAAVSYTFLGLGAAGANITQPGAAYTKPGHEAVLGENSFAAFVTYDAGPQPVDSNGDPYGAPFPAGSSENKTASFEGVLPIYGTTSSVTEATEQPLQSMLYSNDILLTLVTEAGADKQFFDLPNAWLALPGRTLKDVEYYNASRGIYDITGRIVDFEQLVQSHFVNGTEHQYTRFKHKGSLRGQVLIRLKF